MFGEEGVVVIEVSEVAVVLMMERLYGMIPGTSS